MTAHLAAALRAVGQLRRMPAVGCFSRSQTHFRCSSLRYSHANSIPSVQIQMVECIPGIRRFGILFNFQVLQPRPDTHRLPVPIAMRMNWKSEQNILSNPRRQVDQFRSDQLDLSGKVVHPDWIDEASKTTDTFQFHIYAQLSRNE
jgi:hypothetical protein